MIKADNDAIAPKSKKRRNPQPITDGDDDTVKESEGKRDRVSVEVKKFRKDTNFLAAAKEAIAYGRNNREVVDQLFSKGFGANKNSKPYQETMVSIFKNAIAQIENQGD